MTVSVTIATASKQLLSNACRIEPVDPELSLAVLIITIPKKDSAKKQEPKRVDVS